MSEKICWLSPEGKIFPCSSHAEEALKLVESIYDAGHQRNPERFLEERGWIKYEVSIWKTGWVIPMFPQTEFEIPTQSQIDAAFDWTGDNIAEGVSF